jgi:hypothetical protein
MTSDIFSSRSERVGNLGGFGSGGGGRFDDPGGLTGDYDEWEPFSPTDWAEKDPLRPAALSGDPTPYNPAALFSAFRRLPRGWLRAQAWRERQIAAQLIQTGYVQNWAARLPNLVMCGVARRPWEQTHITGLREAVFVRQSNDLLQSYIHDLPFMANYAEVRDRLGGIPPAVMQEAFGNPLAAVFYFRPGPPPFLNPPVDRGVYEGLGLPVLIELDGGQLPLESYGLPRYVPVVVDTMLGIEPLGLPSPASVVNPGVLMQPGMQISGLNTGTLTAVVGNMNGPGDFLLGAQHVLGDPGDPVTVAGVRAGQVVAADSSLDWALADLSALQGAYSIDRTVSGLGMAPSPPLMPTFGLAAQYCGQKSAQAAFGFISGVYLNPPQYLQNLGVHIRGDCFQMHSGAKSGDSGALVLCGQGQALPLSPDYTYHPPAQGQHLPGSILGMLVAQMPAWGPFPAAILAVPAEKITASLAVYPANNIQLQWV